MMKHMVRPFLFFAALAGVCLAFAAPLLQTGSKTASGTSAETAITVVLDAGHGGEDGGAVSASGLQEKHLNLDFALKIRDLLRESGVSVILTRDTDVLLYDRNADYRGRKKALDLQARQKIAEETEGAVFVSIHMNAFSQTQYSGLQVWYSPNDARSAVLAEEIQTTVRSRVQPENDRTVKQSASNIYLLYHLRIPAVLVECGFLSNPDEATLLGTDGYRQQLAQAISLGILSALSRFSS